MTGDQAKSVDNDGEFDLVALARTIWGRRVFVMWTTLAFAVIGLVIAFTLPKKYEATATIFPVVSSSNSSLSEYAGLAALAGVNIPMGSTNNGPGKSVSALLGSRILVERLVSELKLLDQIKVDGDTPKVRERNLVESLQKSLKTKEDLKTGVISVMFQMGTPELAQSVTNKALEILDRLLVEKSLTSDQKKKALLERQIDDQGKKLSEFQKDMASFQKETTLLNPTAQAGKAVDAYTNLVQRKMELELQLATAQVAYSADNPRVSLLKTQVFNIEDQIRLVKDQVNGDLPSLRMAPENMIRYQNLARNLEIATKIYASLQASLEQMTLDSNKEQVYIEVLDTALLPLEGTPSRTMVAVITTLFGLLVAIIAAFALEAFQKFTRGTRNLVQPSEAVSD